MLSLYTSFWLLAASCIAQDLHIDGPDGGNEANKVKEHGFMTELTVVNNMVIMCIFIACFIGVFCFSLKSWQSSTYRMKRVYIDELSSNDSENEQFKL